MSTYTVHTRVFASRWTRGPELAPLATVPPPSAPSCAWGMGGCTPSKNGENGENGENGLDLWLGGGVCTPNENGENGENSENGLGLRLGGGGVYPQ